MFLVGIQHHTEALCNQAAAGGAGFLDSILLCTDNSVDMNHDDMHVDWDTENLTRPPKTFAAPGIEAHGVKAVFIENEPYHGGETRVFAWMGVPETSGGGQCPAMVLLHGGGGTAFAEWVRLWNARGYAAIAIDQCGCIPRAAADGSWSRHDHAGPPGWDASFAGVNEAVTDQWPYHAVTVALRAHSLIASQPGVDLERIGVTGISWGGYLTCLVAGVDRRLKCAVPVYGCGFLGENSVWNDTVFPSRKREDIERWLGLWDPSGYLPSAGMPFCWVSGTNDFAYPLDSLRKSYRLPSGERTLCIRPAMPHGHEAGWAPREIGAFADAVLAGGTPLARITGTGYADGVLWAAFESPRAVVRAELLYTRAEGYWSDRAYNSLPVTVLPGARRVEAQVPPKATVYFINLYDDRGCVVSTEHRVVCGADE